jgi:vacuolar-type H+-ATPase subunit H
MSRVVDDSSPLLEIIRRKEAEVKRRLAAEREAVEAALAEAERRARDLLTAAEVEGRRIGEAQRQATLAETERNAQAIVAQARAEAEMLQRAGEQHMAAAVARAFEIVIGGPHET